MTQSIELFLKEIVQSKEPLFVIMGLDISISDIERGNHEIFDDVDDLMKNLDD